MAIGEDGKEVPYQLAALMAQWTADLESLRTKLERQSDVYETAFLRGQIMQIRTSMALVNGDRGAP